MRRIVCGISMSLLMGAMLLSAGCSKQDRVIMVGDNDPDMIAAIAQGRATLPRFWEAFDRQSPDESVYSLKVQIKDQNGSEYFWLTDIERRDGKTYGRIDNDPNIVRTVKLGDRIPIPEQDIVDWLYRKGDKMVGNYTLRPLFKQMSPQEVARYQAMLLETPAPASRPRTLEEFRFDWPRTTVKDVVAKVGNPDGDLGSGIHILEYKLGDGSSVWIGSADNSRIMYVDHHVSTNQQERIYPRP